jgi:adenylate cyclase class IV
VSNEITVKLKCSINEIKNILENKGFKLVDKFYLDDTYYISKDINITKLSIREILNSYIIIRNIKQYEPSEFINSYNIIKITYKNKNIASNGDIISQEKYDCEIKNIDQGKNILNAIGYKELMNIKENDVVYCKDGLEIAVKDIENGDNLIEVETTENNNELDTTDKLKQKISTLNIPIDESDFFVKKAEIELKKMM